MTLPIMTYSKSTSVSGGSGFLSALRAFLISQGWTSVEYQVSKVWTHLGGGIYGWTAGTEDFLEIFSNGYGSQNLRYRFRMEPHPTDSSVDYIHWTPIDPNNPSYSTSVSTHPVFQDDWQASAYYNRINMPSGTMPNIWFFGLGKRHCFVNIQMTTDKSLQIAFGTIELLPELQGTDEMQFYGVGQYARLYPQALWHTDTTPSYWKNPYDEATNSFSWRWFWWDGASKYYNGVCTNIFLYNPGSDTFDGRFGSLESCVRYNAFTNKRVAMQPTVFVKDPNSGLYHVAGTFPFVYILSQGIGWGDTITFGSDEYLGFPHIYLTKTKGMAFRIS